jgi:hypothetical protein
VRSPAKLCPSIFVLEHTDWPPLRGHVTAARGGVELRPCCPLPASVLPGGDSVFSSIILGTPCPCGAGPGSREPSPAFAGLGPSGFDPWCAACSQPLTKKQSPPRAGLRGRGLRGDRGPTRGVGKARDLHGSEKQKTPPATATASEQPSSAALAGDFLNWTEAQMRPPQKKRKRQYASFLGYRNSPG